MRPIAKPLFRFTVTLLLLTQVACLDELFSGFLGGAASTVLNSGLGSPAGTTATGSNTDGIATGNGTSNATDETGLGDDDDDDDSDAGVLPQASIPLPPGLENSSVSSVDMSGSAVSQGNVGSDNGGMSLVIATELSASLQPKWKSFFANFNQAQATSSACPEGMEYAACVTIGEDGTYKATLADADENATLQFYVYNPETGLLSEPTSDTPNTNLVHVGNDILNITSDGAGNLYGLSDEGKFVSVEFDTEDRTFRVSGDAEEDYSFAQISGATQAVYNAASPTTGGATFVIGDGSVLTEYAIDEGTGGTTSYGSTEASCAQADGCSAHKMKLFNNATLYYSTQWGDGTSDSYGRIYEFYSVLEGSGLLNFTFADSLYEVLDQRFETNPDSTDRSPNFKDVKAYEVYEEAVSGLKTAVAVAENDDGNLRLFAKVDFLRVDFTTIDTRLDSKYTDVYDLTILAGQDDLTELDPEMASDVNNGRGIFTSNIGVTFFDFDSMNIGDINDTYFVMGPDIEIANTISMAVNTDKTVGYVVSSGDTASTADDIITVVDLVGETIKTDVGTNGVIALSDYLPGKTVTDLSPRTITLFNQTSGAITNTYLLVTLGNTEAGFRDSAIVIEL